MGEETCDVGKGGSDGELFDCNICLEMVKDPVVTSCGHLFCWPCLYRWLQSSTNNTSKECPVCKGKITIESVIPIYGRGRGRGRDCDRGGNNNIHIHGNEEESTLKIPPRPTARRVSEEEEEEDEDEDFTAIVRAIQSRNTSLRIAIMEEMIQHLDVQIDSRVVSDDVDG